MKECLLFGRHALAGHCGLRRYLGFDLGRTKYAHAALGFVAALFPGRAEVVYGDSSRTLPAYMVSRPELRCDRLMVDGGHDYEHAKGDLVAFLAQAPCGAKVAMDDMEFPALKRAWREPIAAGRMREVRCESSQDRDARRNWCFAEVARMPLAWADHTLAAGDPTATIPCD